MARAYAKVFFDWRRQMAALSDSERGRLYDAILEYGETGIVPELGGRESILFPVFQSQLDRDAESYQAKILAASKGGLAKAGKGLAKRSKTCQEKEEEKEKEYEQEKDSKDICAERTSAQVITLPLVDKTEYPITENDVTEWANAYPAVDVLAELRRMRVWLNANPTRKKTKAGIRRFVNSWLGHTQDTAKPQKEKKVSKYAEIYDKY